MKHLYTFLAGFAIIMSSCSSSRNAAQTPDDVYYSPSGSRTTAGTASNKDEYYSTAPSDQYVHMRVQDPQRWSYFDDYNAYDAYYAPAGMGYGAGLGYGYPSYGFGYGLGFGPSFGFGFGDPYMCWNSYFMWNSWYNPYFYNPYYGGGIMAYNHQVAAPGVSHLRSLNTTGYRNGLVRNVNNNSSSRSRFYRPGMATTSNYNSNLNGTRTRTVNNNGNNGFYRPGGNMNNNNSGNFRPAFNNSNSQPVRSFTPASSGGGGGGFSRPGRH
jgi:hypothetical protein